MFHTNSVNKLDHFLGALAWLVFGYFFFSVLFLFQTEIEAQAVCLIISFVFVYLHNIQGSQNSIAKAFYWLSLVLGVLAAGYVKFNFEYLF